MKYEDTGLPWVAPSPNIPYPENAICYPCAGLCGEFQGYLNIGVGYTLPFGTFAADWIDADRLKARLDSYGVKGVAFRTTHYKPFFGSSAGKVVHGVQYHFTDYEAADITLIQFYVMQAVHELWPEVNPFEKLSYAMFDKVCGTDYVRKKFGERFKVSDIIGFWTAEVEDFKTLSKKYQIYQ